MTRQDVWEDELGRMPLPEFMRQLVKSGKRSSARDRAVIEEAGLRLGFNRPGGSLSLCEACNGNR